MIRRIATNKREQALLSIAASLQGFRPVVKKSPAFAAPKNRCRVRAKRDRVLITNPGEIITAQGDSSVTPTRTDLEIDGAVVESD
jgi:hypothetical protein